MADGGLGQRLHENLGAAKIELSAEEVAEVRKISERAAVEVPGGRYDPKFMQTVLADTPPL